MKKSFVILLIVSALVVFTNGVFAEDSKPQCLVKLNGTVIEADSITPIENSTGVGQSTDFHFQCSTGNGKKTIPLSDTLMVKMKKWVPIAITSDVDVMVYSLGASQSEVTPPANWQSRKMGTVDNWMRAVLTQNAACMSYLPGASWIWNAPTGDVKPLYERSLFQKSFTIAEGYHVANARISVVGCHSLNGLFINGRRVNTDEDTLCGNVIIYDITNDLKSRENLLSLDVSAPRSDVHGYGGLGFRVDISSIEMPEVSSVSIKMSYNCAVILSSGDFVKGRLVRITPDTVVLEHVDSIATIDRMWIDNIQMNFQPLAETKAESERIHPALTHKNTGGLHTVTYINPLLPPKSSTSSGIVDKKGRVIVGEIISTIDGEKLKVKVDSADDPMDFSLSDIREVFFNHTTGFNLTSLKRNDFSLFARISVYDGNTWTGVITELKDGAYSLDTQYAGVIQLPYSSVTDVLFPYQRLAHTISLIDKNDALKLGKIGLIGIDQKMPRSTQNLIDNLTELGKAMGIEVTPLSIKETVDPNILNAKSYPLLINVNNRQRSFDGWEKSDDVKAALLNYLNDGGDLAHMAPGTPFYLSCSRDNEEWKVKPCPKSINQHYGISIAFPGEDVSNGECIESPNYVNKELMFQTKDNISKTDNFPKTIQFNTSGDTRFRPVSILEKNPTGAKVQPLFDLISSDDKNFGHAAVASRLPGENGRDSVLTYFSYPLVNSNWEGIPATNFLFPWLVETAWQVQ